MILVSKKIGDEIKCGCAVFCRDRFGNAIKIVTSGFTTPCVPNDPPPGSQRLLLDGVVNGEFDLTWDIPFSRWVDILTTGTIRVYSEDDCTGTFGTVAVDAIVSIFCDGSGAFHLLYPLAGIDVNNAQFDTPYYAAPSAVLANGVITILNPEAP